LSILDCNTVFCSCSVPGRGGRSIKDGERLDEEKPEHFDMFVKRPIVLREYEDGHGSTPDADHLWVTDVKRATTRHVNTERMERLRFDVSLNLSCRHRFE